MREITNLDEYRKQKEQDEQGDGLDLRDWGFVFPEDKEEKDPSRYKISPGTAAIVGTLVLTAVAAGVMATTESPYKQSLKTEERAMEDLEANKTLEAANFGIVLRPGVNLRSTPNKPTTPDGKVSDENVVQTIENTSMVMYPAVVKVFDEEWYGFPLPEKGEDQRSKDATAKELAERYVWLSSDVIGQVNKEADNPYAEIVYPDIDVSDQIRHSATGIVAEEEGQVAVMPVNFIELNGQDPQSALDKYTSQVTGE